MHRIGRYPQSRPWEQVLWTAIRFRLGFREQLMGQLFTLVSNRQESQELFTWLLTVNNYNLCE